MLIGINMMKFVSMSVVIVCVSGDVNVLGMMCILIYRWNSMLIVMNWIKKFCMKCLFLLYDCFYDVCCMGCDVWCGVLCFMYDGI